MVYPINTYDGYPQLTAYPLMQGQPPAIVRILQDLRAAVTVTPERYNERHVAELMYHVLPWTDFFP